MRFRRSLAVLTVVVLAIFSQPARTQQTLGSVNGVVTDSSGAVIPKAAVKIRDVSTNFEISAETKSDGSFSAADLPIGTYQITFAKENFQTAVFPQILVQGNRTTTINTQLKPGAASESVTVNATPLLNANRHDDRLCAG